MVVQTVLLRSILIQLVRKRKSGKRLQGRHGPFLGPCRSGLLAGPHHVCLEGFTHDVCRACGLSRLRRRCRENHRITRFPGFCPVRLLYRNGPDRRPVVHRRRSPPHTRSDEQYLRRPRSGTGDMSRPVQAGFFPFRFRNLACTTLPLRRSVKAVRGLY